jgi:hypothetical protein
MKTRGEMIQYGEEQAQIDQLAEKKTQQDNWNGTTRQERRRPVFFMLYYLIIVYSGTCAFGSW